jgi:ABC-type antimicrobial peptide transport system permease subunit
MYLVSDEGNLPITSNVAAVNKGVFSPKMVTIPTKSSNFYLASQIVAGAYPTNYNEIMVSSEFILSRFYGYSLEAIYNQNTVFAVSDLNAFIGQSLYMCGETIITDGVVPTSVIEENCFEYVIRGVLNSYYDGINYTGNIYVTNKGFTDYITYLRDEKDFTRVDEYYDAYISFYLDDIDTGINITAVSDEIGATISNEELREYYETKTLENMLYYIYLAIFFSLIIISGTIDINIVASSVVSRIREIGIYSCIGVSKKSIRNMFVFETLEIALRILLINTAIFVGIALGFKILYKNIVVDLTIYEGIFGINEMFSYEIYFSVLVILGAVGFLFASVLIPSFRAANMRAIDALRSE